MLDNTAAMLLIIMTLFALVAITKATAEDKLTDGYCDLEQIQKSDMTIEEMQERLKFCLDLKETKNSKEV